MSDAAYQKEWTHRKRAALLAALGGKCKRCGFSDSRALQVDHVRGGGVKEIRSYKSRAGYYLAVLKKVLAGSDEYQLLCANCNWIKRAERSELG